MNKLALILLLLLVCGCLPKISGHFEQNKYIRNKGIHILNDSLQLSFKSSEDILYTQNRKELKKTINKGKFKLRDSVLVYGKTKDPDYEYFVTLSKNHNQKYPEHLVVFDTLINNQTLRFLGNPLTEKAKPTLEIELKNIFQSIEVGPTYRKGIGTLMEILARHNNSNKYFAVLNEISQFPTYNKQEEWTKLQLQLTYASFLGNNSFYDHFLNQLESRIVINDTISKIIKANLNNDLNVIGTIAKEAENHKIIMINENHYYPNHRVLVSDLLVKLKDIGYTHFALEALDVKQDSLLNLNNAYPTLKTGFYTSEQNYGNLIRKAKELGYEFIAYENADNNKDREVGQAENLYNKTFKLDPNTKVLVLAGIDHILEKPTKSGKEWMATIFKKKYNIDPLTISQTHLNVYKKEVNATYAMINSKFFENDKLNSVDYLVLNNKSINSTDSSATFLYQNITDRDVQVSLFYGHEILNQSDHDNKIPYFSSILKGGKQYDLPITKNGEIYLYTFDGDGKQIDNQVITPANIVNEKPTND